MRASVLLGSIALAASCLFCSCRHKGPAEDGGDDILLSIDGNTLSLHEVVNRIPVGIDPVDSLALFEDIVDSWVSEYVLSELAESKLPNYEEINRKVEAYRKRLIVNEYLRMMRESKEIHVSPDSLRRFYDLHKGELLTETPLVKGIYLKVASNSPKLDEIRKLVMNGSDESIDRLESLFMGEAIQYDYFTNVWVDWQTIAETIPYRFYDPDAFLESTRDFETSYNGSTYLLHISDYLPSGSEQPYEFALPRITSIMEQSKMSAFEKSLVSSLVEKAIKDGRLQKISYDPVSHKMIRGTVTDNKKN